MLDLHVARLAEPFLTMMGDPTGVTGIDQILLVQTTALNITQADYSVYLAHGWRKSEPSALSQGSAYRSRGY